MRVTHNLYRRVSKRNLTTSIFNSPCPSHRIVRDNFPSYDSSFTNLNDQCEYPTALVVKQLKKNGLPTRTSNEQRYLPLLFP